MVDAVAVALMVVVVGRRAPGGPRPGAVHHGPGVMEVMPGGPGGGGDRAHCGVVMMVGRRSGGGARREVLAVRHEGRSGAAARRPRTVRRATVHRRTSLLHHTHTHIYIQR